MSVLVAQGLVSEATEESQDRTDRLAAITRAFFRLKPTWLTFTMVPKAP